MAAFLRPVALDSADTQAVLLALAELAKRRPGWQTYLREIAAKFATSGAKVFDDFQDYSTVDAIETIATPFPHAKALRVHLVNLLNLNPLPEADAAMVELAISYVLQHHKSGTAIGGSRP